MIFFKNREMQSSIALRSGKLKICRNHYIIIRNALAERVQVEPDFKWLILPISVLKPLSIATLLTAVFALK